MTRALPNSSVPLGLNESILELNSMFEELK